MISSDDGDLSIFGEFISVKDMLKNTKRIGPNKDKQKWVSCAPSAEVEKLLPAALKANGYTV